MNMKINFCLPPTPLTGGPLAIMEYASHFMDMGHDVTITTYPVSFWPEEWKKDMRPYPWYDFKGKIVYLDDRGREQEIAAAARTMMTLGNGTTQKELSQFPLVLSESIAVLSLMESMPDCDINIATAWLTTYAVYFSGKGKPVYFMQHYEEVFERQDFNRVARLLETRGSYELPLYKIANSSWLQKQIYERYGQKIPFSNNAINVEDFSVDKKLSENDGIIRIVSYSDDREWKGFADAAAAMQKIKCEYGDRVEWHAYGREHSLIKPDNKIIPYILHGKIPYAELAQLYAQSDIVLCCSWYESFPLPPLEAMASGTAVVTTRYGTEDYCFDGKNCLCVDARNIDHIYSALKRLIDDPQLRSELAGAGRDTAAKFTWERAAKNREKMLVDIYEGKTEYDIFAPINHGLKDEAGILFTKMPDDLKHRFTDGMLIRQGSRVFLIDEQCKRLVADTELLEKWGKDKEPIIEVDEIECMRIPMGFTLRKESDL